MSRMTAIASLSTTLVVAAAIAVPASLPPERGSHTAPSSSQGPPAAAAAAPKARGGFVLERDAQIAREEPGTHKGGGQTIGYSFFKDVPNLAMVFRKRAFKPGSAIGYHEQKEDEIYYVLSGRGLMTIDGKDMEVGPGDAILTRPGSSHGLKQVGTEDLVIMINYLQHASR
jgi:mannose-6-phosphate isomerase-like protein (cupin superfamily)